MGKGFLILVIGLVLALGLIEGVGWIISRLPGFAQIDIKTAVICMDDAHYVFLKGATLYQLDGPAENGCYQLTEPKEPGARGVARKVWVHCGK